MQDARSGLRVFISDCEGPISKNDNAFEVASHFLPRGDYLFSLISRYDDIQAEIIKRPSYRAGYTLTLIVPFLKAHGVTNKKVEEYSAENLTLICGAEKMLQWVKRTMPSFIVSTSYEHYISSLCSLIGFPYENVYCTKLDLDKYTIDRLEVDMLKQLESELLNLPMIDMPKEARTITQLPERTQETIRRLDAIFGEEIPSMTVGKLLEEVKPVGGEEKANSVRSITERINCNLDEVMYVGDSITDVQAFQLVRRGGGLTISFNGNAYAVRNAEVVVLSENAIITAILADVFSSFGKYSVLNLVKEWNYRTLSKYCSNEMLVHAMSNAYRDVLPKVEVVTEDSANRLVEESSNFRKTVRGEAIGRLG